MCHPCGQGVNNSEFSGPGISFSRARNFDLKSLFFLLANQFQNDLKSVANRLTEFDVDLLKETLEKAGNNLMTLFLKKRQKMTIRREKGRVTLPI